MSRLPIHQSPRACGSPDAAHNAGLANVPESLLTLTALLLGCFAADEVHDTLEINFEFAAGWLDYVGGAHAHGCQATAPEVAATARFTLFAQAALCIAEAWEDCSQSRFGTIAFVLHVAAGRARQISNICHGS